ncbi:TFR2 protein, partial [Furnarius figulus]|nr:TFR2 protein [Furnarius figulus]
TLRWVGPGGEELEQLQLDPEAFCAWSTPGTATGGLVYGHYGRPQDLAQLRARGVSARGQLMLLRLGRGTPNQQVRPPNIGGVGGGWETLKILGRGTPNQQVQEGAGDPFSRGFPSFTGRSPPGTPPGVPPIPAHPISANTAAKLLRYGGGGTPK